jgi:hypothetical protein
MEENKLIQFFNKIHLSVVDAKYLASQALSAAMKPVFLFFLLLFFLSLAISSAFRTAKITKHAPEILASTLGVLKFENYNLVSPDTLIFVDSWRLKELGALISGVKIPQSVAYPIEITIGIDSIKTTQKPFFHIGETAFSTNTLPSFLNEYLDKSWNKILPSPNVIADVDFYKTLFSKVSSKINIFFVIFVFIGIEMFLAISQIWISILIYLLFFGRKLNFYRRLRLLMLATIPYFILMPVSFAAANGIAFTTDIALVAALIMTIRAVTQLDPIPTKGNGNEKK